MTWRNHATVPSSICCGRAMYHCSSGLPPECTYEIMSSKSSSRDCRYIVRDIFYVEPEVVGLVVAVHGYREISKDFVQDLGSLAN